MNKENLALVFNIINALGSVGTLGGFLFLFFKDKSKEKQIEHLSELVILFAKQYELSVRKVNLLVAPDLWLNGATTIGESGELKIDLNNKGEVAYLDSIKLINGDIMVHNEHVPYELEKNKGRLIFGRAITQKSINESLYTIEIIYHDKLNNSFSIHLSGLGSKVKIIDYKEL